MTKTNLGRVVFWMSWALVAFCTMAISIRALAGRLNIFEILMIRNGSGVLVLTALALLRPELRAMLALRHMGLHAFRNTVHYVAQYTWALSLTLLPLATVFALEFTMPFWVALLAMPVLGERMTVSRAGSIVLGFIGILIVVRPGMGVFQPAILLVLACAVGFAVAIIASKQLTASVPTFAILFWMNLMQLPMGLIGGDPGFVFALDASQVPFIAGVAVAGLASHFCLMQAFHSGDATIVVPFDFLRIPLIALVGWLFYSEALDPYVFLGAAFIFVGVSWNLYAEARR